MGATIVVRGRFAAGAFVPNEPLPNVEGPAELIVFTAPPSSRPSLFDVIGKAEVLQTAEDIDAQIGAERDSWGDR